MNKSLLAVLNDAERLLVGQTGRAELAALDEDAAIELEAQIRRARNKYVGQYRRAAAAAVAEHGGRGKARPREHAGGHEGRSVRRGPFPGEPAGRCVGPAVRSGTAGGAARGGQGRQARPGSPGAHEAAPAAGRRGPVVTGEPTGDRSLRSPALAKRRASTRAAGDRRQAKRDSR
jgi:hypothetical protein